MLSRAESRNVNYWLCGLDLLRISYSEVYKRMDVLQVHLFYSFSLANCHVINLAKVDLHDSLGTPFHKSGYNRPPWLCAIIYECPLRVNSQELEARLQIYNFVILTSNSGDLKSGHIQILNGPKEVGLQMVSENPEAGPFEIWTNCLHFAKKHFQNLDKKVLIFNGPVFK